MVDKSDQLRVIGNVTGFIIFALITIPVFFYYIWRRQDFNIHPRAGKLSLLSGLYCIVTSLVVFARGFSKDYDSEDPDSISCDVLHALGFIFPSCFVSPYIFRALKVVVQWENIEPLARFVSVRFSAVVIVLTSVVYTLVGVLVLRDSDNLIGGSNCVAFNHWVYFVVFYTIILVITFPLILKLRTVKDKFYIARELKVQFIILSIYIFTYLIIVICISSESVSKEDVLDNFDLNYYLALLCGASFYVSFIDPYRSGFRRGDPDEDNNVTSTSVLRKPFDSIVINVNLENLMSMTLEEVINSDGLFEVLKRVAQRALCPELIHFIQAARAYKANAEALALQSQSAHVSRDSFSAGTRSYAMPPRRKTMSSADSFVTQWYRRMMPSSDSSQNTDGTDKSEIPQFSDLYESYTDIVDAFIKVDAVGAINISNHCRNATLALMTPAAFSGASAVARSVIFDSAMHEVAGLIRGNLYQDMLMYIAENENLFSFSGPHRL